MHHVDKVEATCRNGCEDSFLSYNLARKVEFAAFRLMLNIRMI